MMLDQEGQYIDLQSGDRQKTFIDPGKLAKHVHNNPGPFIVNGGLSVQAKQEGAAIVTKTPFVVGMWGVPETARGWSEVAQKAVELGV